MVLNVWYKKAMVKIDNSIEFKELKTSLHSIQKREHVRNRKAHY